MTEPVRRNAGVCAITGGLVLIGLGILGTHDLINLPQERILPGCVQSLMFLGPMIIGLGIIPLLYGSFSGESRALGWVVLGVGLLMLAVGGFPWIYTSYLIGGRPGNEGAGMAGTLIFIFVGLPGLAITIAGLALKAKRRRKGSRRTFWTRDSRPAVHLL